MNHAIILLSGQGTRFDKKIDKSLIKVNDKYLFEYIICTLLKNKNIDTITLVVNEKNIKTFEDIIATLKFKKEIKFVVGDSAHRQVSLFNGFKSLNADKNDIVITLDGARPFVSNKLINKSIDVAKDLGFSTAGLSLHDSIINFTTYEDRKNFTLIQTPQSFIAKHFNEDFDKDKNDLISSMGWKLKMQNVFEGDPLNFKITTQDDYEMAKKIALK